MTTSPTLSAAREKAIEALQEAVARDQIELETFEEKMDLVMAAPDHRAIQAALAELPAGAMVVPEVRSSFELAVEPMVMTAIFGGSSRRVMGAVPREIKAKAVFGGVELDLRSARFQPGVTTIHCRAVFGGIDIKVPPGVRLDIGGSAIFGGFDEARGHDASEGSDVVVRVVGRAIFGGVSARRKRPSD